MLKSGLSEDGRLKDTADCLLSQAGRVSGVDFSKGWQNYIDILPGTERKCWAASLVERLMEAGLFVMRHGEALPSQDEPVHRSLQLTTSESKALLSRGVQVMRDLVKHAMAAANWYVPQAFPWLKAKLLRPPPAEAATIQRGLSWRCTVTLAEIFGWVRNGPIWLINVQRWTRHNKSHYPPRLPIFAAGSDVWLDADLILKSQFSDRITRVFKETSQLGTTFSKGYLQLAPKFPCATPGQSRGWIPWIKKIMARSGHTRWHVYTDSSWTPPPLSEVSLFATIQPGSKAGAGIVFFRRQMNGILHRCIA